MNKDNLEKRVEDLNLKLSKPEPQLDMGSRISIQFGCDEILTRSQIVEAVTAERSTILKKYRGLPDNSEIPISRHAILDVTWKR